MAAPPDDDALWARSLHCSRSGAPVLTDVSLAVRTGEVVAVLGPRGSGKTTLLQCLSGQRLADGGEVHLQGTPVHLLTASRRERLRRERTGWIGPEPALVPELTVWENAALPLMLRGTPAHRARAGAMEWLERLDMDALAGRRPASLSRSEQQRTALARALAGPPDVLFADDPTACLHRAEGALMLRTVLAAVRSHGITTVLATCDPGVAARANRTVALVDGRRTDAPAAAEAEGLAACSLSV
ncbi:ABC transporter ATP-binding protein [Streptomyces clavuligerus]|uniref:ABC transporter ATP-binding protein n=1 Tax=Streptomyces clavuligerus TaxID=1901 RepID=E2Q925_STRCL|nr:ATP-binding cassette domain-containing protein [Streptomyces clavuligerus]ANW21823.1 ABC transporter ATP-binding protein [Streptomyces clavuligerus]AXU16453.1 ATP-binding cassette domain-containing protein [Streptomyces clavuligerus]EFG09639.1 ABC transporter ATP-binding protein [Streptomyces clavuligerus]MBY6302257.1 ATP-binding cassette domain-containing protein [Streptomyces clavuligerus]QCS09217.1 ABC transporter ATP-binding protein [Streptomyces clavuligerus]